MTTIHAQAERKRQDRSVCRAEKRLCRARMLRVRGLIHPTSAVCATTDTARGEKRLPSEQNQAILKSSGRPLGECRFTTQALEDDTKLYQLASAFLGKSYSYGMGGFGGAPGDLVQRENDRAQVDGIDRLLDVDEFRRRLTEVLQGDSLNEQQKTTVSRFLSAWEKREAGQD